jgi:hypothetical protein
MWITSLNSHFPPPESPAQDVEEKKAELKTPHSKSLNQDIVASPKWQKCGLKYVIYIHQAKRQGH